MSHNRNMNCIIFDYNHDNCSNCSDCSSCNDNEGDNYAKVSHDVITSINSNIEDCIKSNTKSSIGSRCQSHDDHSIKSEGDNKDNKDNKHEKTNLSLCPECPLQLIKQIEICGTHIRDVIASISDNQILVFKNIQFIIGKCLVLVVPKIIKNNCKKYVSVELDNDVIICDNNGKLINVHIVTLCDKYYICIPITESMIPECELVLVIRKLKMYLNVILCDILDNTSNSSSKCESKSKCKSESKSMKKHKTCIDAWKWIIGNVVH